MRRKHLLDQAPEADPWRCPLPASKVMTGFDPSRTFSWSAFEVTAPPRLRYQPHIRRLSF
jgi:hypothetical protein